MGISYNGSHYDGWQSQSSGKTVQDQLERALARFMAVDVVHTVCAGRTDAGVHGLNQVVHFDTQLDRPSHAWVRGTNSFLPPHMAVQWAQPVLPTFHARASAVGRRYVYMLLESPVRPSVDHGRVGWVFRPLNLLSMQSAASYLIGEHDFTSFRASACQANSPVKDMRRIDITRRGNYWRFDFEASAFLHHMIRNIMGCLVAIGAGNRPPSWMKDVLVAKSRDAAAPTFAPDGLYFLGPIYDATWSIPDGTPVSGWLP